MTSPSALPAAAGDAPRRRTFLRFLALSLVAGLVGDRLLAAGIELSDGNPLRLDGMLSMFVGLIAGREQAVVDQARDQAEGQEAQERPSTRSVAGGGRKGGRGRHA